MADSLLTYEDLSARWKIAINTLRQWVMRGVLVPIRLGRAVRFKESYIEALEDKGFLTSNSIRR